MFRNRSRIEPELHMESWSAVRDGRHNSNTDITWWSDSFWLVHANSPFHFFSKECKLMLWRSPDAQDWTLVREFSLNGEDIRDPKLAVIHDSLFLYAYKSRGFDPMPYMTVQTMTQDGTSWAPLRELTEQEGWLLWRPKTLDGKVWYASAHKLGSGMSKLFETQDGFTFTERTIIHQDKCGIQAKSENSGESAGSSEGVDETDIAFLPDGSMISTQRLEYTVHLLGNEKSCTNLTAADAPYKEWKEIGKDYTTRLDGPALFSARGGVYAAGRCDSHDWPPLGRDASRSRKGVLSRKEPRKISFQFNKTASLFTGKHTSLFQVTRDGMVWLSDLPSAGDTSYCGTVQKDDFLYISYYSSNIKRDWPWILGMLLPSEVRIARIPLDALENISKIRFGECKAKGAFKLVKPV